MKLYKKTWFLVLAAGVISVVAAIVSPFAEGQSPRSRTKVADRREVERPVAQPGQIDLNRSSIYVYVDKNP